jgi:hypothetical protein
VIGLLRGVECCVVWRPNSVGVANENDRDGFQSVGGPRRRAGAGGRDTCTCTYSGH